MKNKKILFLVLLGGILLLPYISQAAGSIPSQLQTAIDNVRFTARVIGGAMVVIGFCVAGILFLASAGSPEKTGTAKKALIAGVIGAAIIVLSMGTDVLLNIMKGILGT